MIILVDMDDTIEDLLGSWCNWLNNNYGTSVEPESINQWEVKKFFPQLTVEEVFSPFDDKEFWKTVKPKSGSIKYLKKLIKEGNEVYIVTASHYKSIFAKYTYVLKRYFSFIDWNHVIITSNKQLISGDILIDDGPHNLENGKYIKILFTAPHNKSYNAEENGMIRVSSWSQVYNVVHKIQGSQE